MSRLSTVLACVAATIATPALSQDPNTDPIAKRLPADTTSILVARDPLPHVRRMLGSKPLEQFFKSTRDLQEELFGTRLTPAVVARQLTLFEQFVPREIVMAAPERTVVSIFHGMHAMVAVALLMQSEDSSDAEGLQTLRDCLQSNLACMQPLDATAWIIARSERTADDWFETAYEFAEQLPAPFEFQAGDTSFELRVDLAGVDKLAQKLEEIGCDKSVLEGMSFRARLTLDGDRLQLDLGDNKPGPLAPDLLGPLWRSSNSQMLFSKLEMGPGADIPLAMLETINAAPDGSGEDADDLMLRLYAMTEPLFDASPSLSQALDLGETVTFTAEHTYSDEDVAELPQPSKQLVRCLDPDLGPFALIAAPLDEVLVANIDQVATELMKRIQRPGFASALGMLYGDFGDVLEYLESEDAQMFDPGVAIVTAPAKLRTLRLRPTRPTQRDLPFCAIAVVAKAQDNASANQFLDDLSGHLAASMRLDSSDIWHQQDVDADPPARMLQWRKLFQVDEGLELDADFAPHALVHDGFLLISTDLKLTRRLVDRMSNGQPLQLPLQNPLAWSQARGDQLAAATNGIARFVELAGEGPEFLGPIMNAMAMLLGSVDRVESHAELDGNIYREVDRLILK